MLSANTTFLGIRGGIDPNRGMYEVHQVAMGSPAAMMGVAPGDYILRVNGRLISNAGDLRMAQRQAGGQYSVQVLRPGQMRPRMLFYP